MGNDVGRSDAKIAVVDFVQYEHQRDETLDHPEPEVMQR